MKPYLEVFVALHGPKTSINESADIASLLKTLIVHWDSIYSRLLPRVARSYIHELLDVRNRWAHEQPFSVPEAERALDTIKQLSVAVGAPMRSPSHPPRLPAADSAVKWSGQRAMMRQIYSRTKGSDERAVREYAAAERAGQVQRKGNKSGLTPEAYARALLADGLKKGWLK